MAVLGKLFPDQHDGNNLANVIGWRQSAHKYLAAIRKLMIIADFLLCPVNYRSQGLKFRQKGNIFLDSWRPEGNEILQIQ